MDREELDRVAVRLAGDSKEISLDQAMGKLRHAGYSVVESSYVMVKAYGISLGEAKSIAVALELKEGRCGSPLENDLEDQGK